MWKKDKFGKIKSFFVTYDKNKCTQHLFIYDLEGYSITLIWFSSYINVTIKDLYFAQENQILNILDSDNGRTRFLWHS